MGGSSSTQSSVMFDSSVLNQNITNILNKSVNRTNFGVENAQNIKLNIGGNVCGNIMITQDMVATMTFVDEIDSQTTMDIKNQIKSDLSNESSQTFSKVSDMLSNILNKTNNNMTMAVTNRVSNIVEKNITTEHLNDIVKSVANKQNVEVNIMKDVGCTPEISGGIQINQDMLITLQSNSIISDVIKMASEDAMLTSIVNSGKQETAVTEKGINSMLDSLVGMINNITANPLLLAVILGVILVAGLVMYKSASVLGQSPTTTIVFFVIVAIILIFVMMWYAEVWIFKKDGGNNKWACQIANNEYTGGCSAGKGELYKYDNDATCKATCAGWAVQTDSKGLPTGICTSGKSIINFPYPSKEMCEKTIKDGKDGWVYRCDATKKTCSLDNAYIGGKLDVSSAFATQLECANTCK